MNFNISNIHTENFSLDVQKKYQFPEDKDFILRYMRSETTISRADLNEISQRAKQTGTWLTAFILLGLTSYTFLLMPGGKVIRDRYDASLSVPRRVLRRFLPFIGIAFPIYVTR